MASTAQSEGMGVHEFGDLIRKARGHRSALQIATDAGLSYTMVADFERGAKKYPPPPDVLAKLVPVLGLTERSMLRAWGYLSTEDDAMAESLDVLDPIEQGIVKITPLLTPEHRRMVLAFSEFLASRK